MVGSVEGLEIWNEACEGRWSASEVPMLMDWTLPIPLAPDGLVPRTVSHGTVLIAQGSREPRVVWIVEGEAEVLRRDGGEQFRCGLLGAPGHAGLLSLTAPRRPRLAELRARGAVRILEWRPDPRRDDRGPWGGALAGLRAAMVSELRAHLRILHHLRPSGPPAPTRDPSGDPRDEEPRRLAARLRALERAPGEAGPGGEIIERLLLLQVAGLPGAL